MSDRAAESNIVETRATRVTLFEDRAEVVRSAEVGLPAGTSWIALGGVTPYVDDRSAQARCEQPGVRVLAARVKRRYVVEGGAGREELEALEAEARAAAERVALAMRSHERGTAEREWLEDCLAALLRALGQIPPRSGRDALPAWRAGLLELHAGFARSALALVASGHAVQDAQEDRVRAEARLAQAQVRHPRWEASIEVQVEVAQPGRAQLEVVYRTPCALWRPEHLARLITDGDEARKGRVAITTWATAWQCTGESWKDVEACFSTARPARDVRPPVLADDLLATRRKSEEERKTVTVESRDQAIAVAGLASGGRRVDEMPGVDDGGVPLSFRAEAPVTLPSDGEPYRIEIGRVALDAEVARVLMPELTPVAHLKATATLQDVTPLLAGPVHLARGSGMVGRARLDFVSPGEPFAIGFGSDDGIRARRTRTEKRDQTFAIGTQRIERTVRLFLSNLSDRDRTVRITERIPVSEIAEVEVELKDAPGFELERDGFLRAEIGLAARTTRELEIRYEIRAKPNVQLPF